MSKCVQECQNFVKLEEFHIATANKPVIRQNQSVAQYVHRTQPYILQFMQVGLHHSTRSLKSSTGNEVIGKYNILDEHSWVDVSSH